jgi:two-component system OmpR family sensor kinase
MSLTWRLIVSYGVIIVVTLILALMALFVIARPLQNRIAQRQLTTQVQAAQRQLNTLYQRGTTTERVLQQLNRRSELTNSNARYLLVDPNGNVLFDSQRTLNDQHLVLPRQDNQPLPGGTLSDPAGDSFNFALAPVGPQDSAAAYLLTIAPRNPRSSRLLSELGSGFIVAGAITLVLSLLIGIFIARSISRPLKQISTASTVMAAGNYAIRVPEKGPLEVRRLASSFNLMAGQVESGQQAMRDFVSNVSHELKTPLTSIQGFSQAIMEGAITDEDSTQRAAKIIHEEAARMTRMVEDLLDLARIDSGQVVMQKSPLNLENILRSTVDRLRPQAAEKQIQLQESFLLLPRVVGDGDRLAQVFTNLLDNAIRHTPTQGRVSIQAKVVKDIIRTVDVRPEHVQAQHKTSVSERGDFVEVNITDSGPGIPPEDLARIFERFYQVDKSRKRGKGTGLGLAIIKEIVDSHSGYVRVSSYEGQSTTFTVLLPVTEASARTIVSSRR